MANNIVVATLNINFSDDTTTDKSGVLKLEVDDREDGKNGGDTSFAPGDDVYYFLFKDSNVTVLEHQVTAGGFSPDGTGTKSIDENVTFSNSDTSSLNYPPDGAVTMKWLGRCFEIKGSEVTANTILPEVNGSELKMPNGKTVAGVLNVSYESTGDLYKLAGVPADFTEVLVIAIGQVT